MYNIPSGFAQAISLFSLTLSPPSDPSHLAVKGLANGLDDALSNKDLNMLTWKDTKSNDIQVQH